MFMLNALLFTIAGLLVIFLFKPNKDKQARKSIEKLANEFNKTIYVFDAGDVTIKTKDYDLARTDRHDERIDIETKEKFMDMVRNHDKALVAITNKLNIDIIEKVVPATKEKIFLTTVPKCKKEEVVVPKKKAVKKVIKKQVKKVIKKK